MSKVIRKAYKLELNPTKEQIVLFKKSVGTARYAYNWGLNLVQEALDNGELVPNAIELHKRWVEEKNSEDSQFPWAKEISKCSPQFAFRNLETAVKRWFKKISGKPNFKRKNCNESYTLDGTIKIISPTKIHLPKIGIVKLKEPILINTSIKTLTVSLDVDRWFLSFSQDEELEFRKSDHTDGTTIGIDLGLKTFAVCSNQEEFIAPKPLKNHTEALKRKQRAYSRTKKGSKNREKARIILAKEYRKIRNIRNDFIQKLTTTLTKTKEVIVVETLKIQNLMKNHKQARAWSDIAVGKFVSLLICKGTWYDCEVVKADQWFPSTKLCSNCGNKKQTMKLSERTYVCENCNFVCDRDLNASINLKNLYKSTVSYTGSNASEEQVDRPSLKEESEDCVLC